MNTVIERAYAKLNLTLGVLYKRADGYHALDSVMQSVDLYDTLVIERARDVVVTSTGMTLPYDNTVRRAAERYRALTGCGAFVRVAKRIPAEAGMGGGSADAASTLWGMQRLYERLDERTLFEVGASVGADVPFCMRGGTMRAEGIGDVLTKLPAMPLHFVVVKPQGGVSTKKLFSLLKLPRTMPDNAACFAALGKGDVHALAKTLFNALEEPALSLCPEIAPLKSKLLGTGALAASMTGSGSAVFGLFESVQAALEAEQALKQSAPFVKACASVQPSFCHTDVSLL